MRLKSKSAVSCTRARPGPTTEVTIDSTCSRMRRSNASLRSSAVTPPPAVVGAAVGQQPAGLVDHRHALRLQPVDRAGDEMADRAHLLRLPACRAP